ncbi:PEP-CTERM sorting domain-containing protein [Akkermansia sp.]|uniref:PEP-CTERM sorting domain-containing protein n=1 Tax=Akkermansia sp. TaxID=1872421 RepID=UPI0025C34577|nr:PEP-CTERM sorting domain-containing protein [Akkermansia sp.]MCD8063737.1 PEP-CTERM sorting domain-containing protein [Akkermansia sp.]
MKKTLFILATMVAAVAAEASTVLISFGINSGNGTAVVDGTYLGESGQKVNKISTGSSNSYTSGTLVTSGGDATGITLTTGGVCCGSGGVLTNASAKDSALGQSDKFYNVFGQDMSTGNPMGGVINGNNPNGNFTMSLNNLSAGTYTLTMLVGRGNNYGTGNTSSFSLDGTGISNISASLDDYSTGSGATLNGATVTGNTHTGDWMLITYTFDVAADGTRLDIQSQGGTGNINALALTSVPEPATAGLGLLGLGALVMRRKRA